MLRALEQEAAGKGRSLLTLITRGGDPAESLYRAEHWTEAGRIPDFARGGGGEPHQAVVFWKNLPTA